MKNELLMRLRREWEQYDSTTPAWKQDGKGIVAAGKLSQLEWVALVVVEECARTAEQLDNSECDTGFGKTQHDAAEAIRALIDPP